MAFEFVDPDAPSGDFVHWLAYGVKPSAPWVIVGDRALHEGRNSTGRIGYTSPCPPPGPAHKYHWIVFALDRALLLPDGYSRQQLETAISGNVTAEGELVTPYSHTP